MEEYFKKLIDNISLTVNQREDAITKYKNVCKTLYKEFYNGDFQESSKFLFGSYKKKTTISHLGKDVDVIFRIPKKDFYVYQNQENGPANLLTKVKNILKDTYSTTDKIKNWTKVVLVDFQSFKVEVLPALENDDGTFTIPNTSDGDDWQIFNPKKEIDKFFDSNKKNGDLTRELIKIIKKWKIEKTVVSIKSYKIDVYVINFLENYDFINYPKLIKDFFSFLELKVNETFVDTAYGNAEKALEFFEKNELKSASSEYKKMFGEVFPAEIKSFNDKIYVSAPNEIFIQSIFSVLIDKNIRLSIETYCKPKKGGFMRKMLFNEMLSRIITKKDELEFNAVVSGVSGAFITKWKVRNFGNEAERNNKLRGEILDDNNGPHKHKDYAVFYGDHFLECYLIKDNVCVAIKRIDIPISNI